MLELTRVTKTYPSGVTAVNDVSLSLEHGVIGLLGPNGAGKTTLMQMIATITKPTAGRIVYNGHDLASEPDAIRRRLGYLPQDFGVYENLTAFEFLAYLAALKGMYDTAKLMHLLQLVNLHSEAHKQAGSFSGGMKQRLGIAQALLNDPEIIIVDEPTAGLDPEERVRFRNILSELGSGKLVILSTHIVPDVEAVATHILVMNKGRLVASATPEEFLTRARGRVWEAEVRSSDFESLRSRLKIARVVRGTSGVRMRIVHEGVPLDGAQAVEPDLEDAFLASVNGFRGSDA